MFQLAGGNLRRRPGPLGDVSGPREPDPESGPTMFDTAAPYARAVAADLDPRDLSEVRRRVVDPVVRSVILPEELEDIVVHTEGDSVNVTVRACGELVTACWLGVVGDEPWDALASADHLSNTLSHELPMTSFAWGEERHGRYEVPGPVGR